MGLDMYIYDENENQVAYWRKFNALHKWFVNHVQDGVDECQKSRDLTKDDISNILYVLKEIKKNPLTAPEMMPTSQGMFFGSLDYDEYFMESVDETIPVFERMLEQIEYGNKLHYQSSW